MSATDFDHVDDVPRSVRLRAHEAVSVVVSDDHNYERGVDVARAVAHAHPTALARAGPRVPVRASRQSFSVPAGHRGRSLIVVARRLGRARYPLCAVFTVRLPGSSGCVRRGAGGWISCLAMLLLKRCSAGGGGAGMAAIAVQVGLWIARPS